MSYPPDFPREGILSDTKWALRDALTALRKGKVEDALDCARLAIEGLEATRIRDEAANGWQKAA